MGGPVSEDEVVMMQYRIIREKEMSGSDLVDYCSPESTFFKMFRPFMSPVSRIQRLEGITIAEETFVYQVEVRDWANHIQALTATKTTGANGEYVKSRVDFRLAERHWIERVVLVMDLSDASKRMGVRVDGFLGQDVLRDFAFVKIDFKANVIEFTQS
jgi:hypothetical protein